MSTLARRFWTPWRITWTSIASATVLVAAFIGWQYWLFTGGIFRTSAFNGAEWKSLNKNTADSSCYRGGMAHDIRTNILHKGLTQAEVEKLLGAPDSTKNEVHSYFLGMCSGLRIDFDTLDVHFTPAGKLLEVQILQH